MSFLWENWREVGKTLAIIKRHWGLSGGKYVASKLQLEQAHFHFHPKRLEQTHQRKKVSLVLLFQYSDGDQGHLDRGKPEGLKGKSQLWFHFLLSDIKGKSSMVFYKHLPTPSYM